MTISTRCWRAVLVLTLIQLVLAALALAGLARAEEGEDLEKKALHRLLLENTSAGASRYSVEPCEGCEGTWSSHYSAHVRQETRETASARYRVIVDAWVDEARALLCIDQDDDCEPYGGEISWSARQRWTLEDLLLVTATVAIHESGLREDVQTGRGRSGHPSDDGGEGRGPGNEACLLQIHPTIAARFVDEDEAGEDVMESLLGLDRNSVRRCLRTGMRMLIHSRAYCAWKSPGIKWSWATFSLYGSGQTCSGWKTTGARELTLWSLRRKWRAIVGEMGGAK